jgi:hypothetical protein
MFPNDDDVPREIGVACCAQFAVSKSQVLSRPKADYERYLKWLLETKLDDQTSGKVLEYMWHIIYGKDPVLCVPPRLFCLIRLLTVVSCPPITECYCNVYGREC